MKKVVSCLLCLLLVLSSMGMVAFAEVTPVIDAENAITDTKLPQGTKMQISATVENLGDNCVVAFLNGTKTVLTADTAGNYNYNGAIAGGYNEIYLAVVDGDDNILDRSEVWSVYGLTYVGTEEVKTNATWDGSDGTTGMNVNWIEKYAYNETETDGNGFLRIRSWGAADADPTGSKESFAGNVQIASAAANMAGVTKISVDYRYDKVEVIGNVDETTHIGTPTKTVDINSLETMNSANFSGVSGDVTGKRSTADATILMIQSIFDNTVIKKPSGSETPTELRESHPVWQLDVPTGKPMFTAFNADGSQKTFYADIDYADWNNYSVIIDVPNNMMYGYVNDNYVGSGYIYATTVTSGGESVNYLTTTRYTSWPNVRNMRIYRDYPIISYTAVDNFVVSTYADGFAPTKTSISATNKITSSTLPAGTKMNIEAIVSNLPVGAKVKAFANGTQTVLTSESGKYYYRGTLEDGYNSIYLALVGADGNILTNDEGEELKTQTWNYFAFSPVGEATTNFSNDFENGTEEITVDSVVYNVPKTTNGVADSNTYINGVMKAGKSSLTEFNGNHYMQHTVWSSKVSDPTVAGTDGTENPTRAVYGASVSGLSGIVEMSVNFRFEKVELIDNTTGDISSAVSPTATHLMGSSAIGLPPESAVMVAKYYSEDFYEKYKETGIFKVANNVLNALVYDEDGNEVLVPLTTDPSQWHNYKAVVKTADNTIYVYVDNELVATGLAFAIPADGEKKAIVPTKLDSACYIGVQSPRLYASATNHVRSYTNFDNFVIKTYSEGATAPSTNAFVNVSANGVGLVPANLSTTNKVVDMAIIAKADDGSVDIHSFDAATTTETYKYFTFAKPAVKVYVWQWGTLKPLGEPVFGAE